MDEKTKRIRLNCAMTALTSAGFVTGDTVGSDFEDGITDLMVDLLHLCVQKGFDAKAIQQRVKMHFEEEA